MKKIFLPLVFLALLSSSCVMPGTMVTTQPTTITATPTDQEIQVRESVQGERSDQLFAFYASEHKSALNILKLNYIVQTTSTSTGSVIKTIDGITIDSQHYWQLYVNGQPSKITANQYYPKDQDYLQWKQDPLNSKS